MNVTFVTTTRAKLSQLPIVSGQLVYLNDENTSYYDMGSSRYLVTAVREVSALPNVGYEGIIYVVTTDSPRTSWLWDTTNTAFVNIAGARATTSAPGIVQPDGTTVTVNNGVISSNFSQTEKTKLAGIADGATATAFTPTLTTGVKFGELEINGTTYDMYAPAGAVSYNPIVTAGTRLGELTINGVTQTIYTPVISDATTSASGLMSAADKTKLDGVQTGATAVSYTPTLTSGAECGKITINGTAYSIYSAAASGVTGVKGNSESSYRTGNVNITKANIGLGNVPNPTIVTGSLAANATSITLTSSAITTSSTIAVYSTVADLEYTSISVATGSVTIGFPGSHAAATVKVYVF